MKVIDVITKYNIGGNSFTTKETVIDEGTSYWCCWGGLESTYADTEKEAIKQWLKKTIRGVL